MPDGDRRGDGDGSGDGVGDDVDGDDTRDALAERRGLDAPVYEPAEDSGLLAEAAVEHARGVTLEVGTGSGWVAERVAADGDADRVIGSDVNPHATERARGRGVEAVRGDLLAPFGDGALDAVLFNPPYLPTDPDNEWDDWQEVALSGGETGRALIEPFLDDLPRALAPGGVALLLVSSLTGFPEVVEYAVDRGLNAETVAEESYPFETLSILALRHRE
ncbi:class I SAM-dependent methyltransferase [Halobaculum sp. CBA1158]|uniref:HemK2/MTQ2 family protein methyltransferase n=1 Tax=Halobaculum sp. CBA1158 TaxID=2904243 RepID=UPI001F1C6C01|nr:HemK2/MTQ2 family protein methyltransferase [Halobaculum sp. CBA1158]UIO98574.1 class I SAM-dependent methyltransferase [Halobaculum sp. CBA1158]